MSSLPNLRLTLHDVGRSPERLAALRSSVPADLGSIDGAAQRYVELYEKARSAR